MLTINSIRQRRRFATSRQQFPKLYKKLQKLGKEPFVVPFWQTVNNKVIASFEPLPKIDFLNNRAIKDTMFVDGDKVWLDKQLSFLKKKLGNRFAKQVTEDMAGEPVLLNDLPFKTSHNTIHHLYHIYFYLEQMKLKGKDIGTVVEWGGGYGNFAKLWQRDIDPNGTYIIIDTALFCSVQWLYLSTVLGTSKVHVLESSRSKIEPGKVNLVPLALLDKVNIQGDLFVSTWGLSESLDKAQDYVLSHNWFGCSHLLIGYQDSSDSLKYASRLGKLAKKAGAKIIDIEFIPGNHYAFK